MSPKGREASLDPISYRIDRDDRLVEVSDTWSEFALANGGAALQGSALLGRSLWEFITDSTTVHLYQLMVERIRRGGAAVRFLFRCDAPHRRRLFTMEVSPGDEGSVLFRTTPVREQARQPVALRADPPHQPFPLLAICGWCNRFRLGDGAWVEAEDAIAALGIFDERRAPDMTHGMCPDCFRAVTHALESPGPKAPSNGG